jgi:large subunit ribosomal protein L4
MTTLDVRDAGGAVTGSVELPAEIFDVTANVPLMHQVVVAQLAAARQGTHKTKTRGEVSGGGKKPYRQKGTGRARQGSTRAPQFTGGGVVHGPVPRDYSQRTPKKMKQAALRGALSDRARGGRVHVLASFVTGETPSTKTAVTALKSLTLGRHALVVVERSDELTWKSLRNVAEVHLIAPDQLNTYDVLVSDDVVFTEPALAAFLAGAPKGKSAKATARSSEAEAVVSETPATDAGETKPAGEGVPTDELVEEVAEQTSNDLLVEPVNEALSEAAEEETK